MPLPGMRGGPGEMALYAGQSVQLVREPMPAARIVRTIAAQAQEVIERL